MAPGRPRRLPASRARPRRARAREMGWSRDCWRRTAASKPAPAGLGEIKNKTNQASQTAGEPGRGLCSGAGGAAGSGPGAARAGARLLRSPDLPLLARETWGARRLPAAGCAPCRRSCFPRTRPAGDGGGGGQLGGGGGRWELGPQLSSPPGSQPHARRGRRGALRPG